MPDQTPFGDPLTQLAFSISENPGVYAVLIGSGVSRAADIPTGWELTLGLIRRVALSKGVKDQPDWAVWYQDAEGKEPNYSNLLAKLAASPAERRSILHNYIEPTEDEREEGKKTPTEAHQAIAMLVRRGFIKVIITTNFDRLMENALREQGVEPTVISSVDALSGAEPLAHSSCYLVKLHGDYKDARILNTEQELNKYPKKYDDLLDRIFDEYGLVICGWSGEWDHALRAAILRAPNRRYPLFWAARGELGDGAEEIVALRYGKTVQIDDANSFFQSITERVETLERTGAQNPLSIDLVINSVKRYLSDDQFRIQLADLISEETGRLIELLKDPNLNPQAEWTPEEFKRRVEIYEAATERLAKVFGVMGRWGTAGHLALALDAISAVEAQAQKQQSGNTAFIGLQTYPAVLIFTSFGLGLVKAQGWDTLFHLFKSNKTGLPGEPKRIVERLFLQAWNGAGSEIWKQHPDHERKLVPLSDHLCAVFSDWGKKFLGTTHDFEEIFQTFEILGSFAHLDIYKPQLEEKLAQKVGPQGYKWTPIGKSCWDRETREKIISRLTELPTQMQIISAGFANQDREYIALAIENFRRLSQAISWH